MKLFLILYCLLICLLNESVAQNSRFDVAINKWRGDPSLENFLELGGELRGLYRNRINPTEDPDYQRIRDLLLSIPNHAQLLADEIKREQKEVARYPTNTGPRVSYDTHRMLYFGTLGLLPSPKSVAVLGNFLSDDKDTPYILISPDSDWGENPRANSFSAAVTLSNLGLRDSPVEGKRMHDNLERGLADTRLWWEEIRTGRKTFSFLGGRTEYRFKPDGSWDTIKMMDPPDDKPASVQASRPENNRDEPNLPHLNDSDSMGRPWKWITAAGATLLGLAWFALRHGKYRQAY